MIRQNQTFVKIGRWLNRLRFKTLWSYYNNGVISYGLYKEHVFYMVNSIRKAIGYSEYCYKTFDDGWQYRQLCADKYKDAYNEMFNLVIGWW